MFAVTDPKFCKTVYKEPEKKDRTPAFQTFFYVPTYVKNDPEYMKNKVTQPNQKADAVVKKNKEVAPRRKGKTTDEALIGRNKLTLNQNDQVPVLTIGFDEANAIQQRIFAKQNLAQASQFRYHWSVPANFDHGVDYETWYGNGKSQTQGKEQVNLRYPVSELLEKNEKFQAGVKDTKIQLSTDTLTIEQKVQAEEKAIIQKAEKEEEEAKAKNNLELERRNTYIRAAADAIAFVFRLYSFFS